MRQTPKAYLTYLEDTHEQLVEAIREAENEQWHHEAPSTPGGKIYARLLTWLDEVERRRAWYYGHTGQTPKG